MVSRQVAEVRASVVGLVSLDVWVEDYQQTQSVIKPQQSLGVVDLILGVPESRSQPAAHLVGQLAQQLFAIRKTRQELVCRHGSEEKREVLALSQLVEHLIDLLLGITPQRLDLHDHRAVPPQVVTPLTRSPI